MGASRPEIGPGSTSDVPRVRVLSGAVFLAFGVEFWVVLRPFLLGPATEARAEHAVLPGGVLLGGIPLGGVLPGGLLLGGVLPGGLLPGSPSKYNDLGQIIPIFRVVEAERRPRPAGSYLRPFSVHAQES